MAWGQATMALAADSQMYSFSRSRSRSNHPLTTPISFFQCPIRCQYTWTFYPYVCLRFLTTNDFVSHSQLISVTLTSIRGPAKRNTRELKKQKLRSTQTACSISSVYTCTRTQREMIWRLYWSLGARRIHGWKFGGDHTWGVYRFPSLSSLLPPPSPVIIIKQAVWDTFSSTVE